MIRINIKPSSVHVMLQKRISKHRSDAKLGNSELQVGNRLQQKIFMVTRSRVA